MSQTKLWGHYKSDNNRYITKQESLDQYPSCTWNKNSQQTN